MDEQGLEWVFGLKRRVPHRTEWRGLNAVEVVSHSHLGWWIILQASCGIFSCAMDHLAKPIDPGQVKVGCLVIGWQALAESISRLIRTECHFGSVRDVCQILYEL